MLAFTIYKQAERYTVVFPRYSKLRNKLDNIFSFPSAPGPWAIWYHETPFSIMNFLSTYTMHSSRASVYEATRFFKLLRAFRFLSGLVVEPNEENGKRLHKSINEIILSVRKYDMSCLLLGQEKKISPAVCTRERTHLWLFFIIVILQSVGNRSCAFGKIQFYLIIFFSIAYIFFLFLINSVLPRLCQILKIATFQVLKISEKKCRTAEVSWWKIDICETNDMLD